MSARVENPGTGTWEEGHFIAGDVALDFANTLFRRIPEPGPDLFTDAHALIGWFHHAGITTPEQSRAWRPGDAAALQRARELRGLLWELFDSRVQSHELPGPALAAVLRVAGVGLAEAALTITAHGAPNLLRAEGAFALIAVHATRLALTTGGPPIRTCDRCGWFFLDTSRGRRRRWCSMKTCGNQAKAARYRSTHP